MSPAYVLGVPARGVSCEGCCDALGEAGRKTRDSRSSPTATGELGRCGALMGDRIVALDDIGVAGLVRGLPSGAGGCGVGRRSGGG
mmetsp:Transcript_13486/g.34596  ORF Transcript_13486/g.34596 Transcript_13486/m.34596 type:complete len:86 (+) Transcript_13486:977-1234(+)